MGEKEIDLSDLRVLYVEDDHGVLDAIAKPLSRTIGELYMATNGKDGLHLFSLYQPDIVITDIKMPIMDGLKMARQMRAQNPKIPIVIVSAFNENDYITGAIDIGVNQYLFKPIGLDHLLLALNRCLAVVRDNAHCDRLKTALERQTKLAEEYKKALDLSSIVSRSDRDGFITSVNAEFCGAFGCEREDMIGRKYDSIASPDENPRVQEALRRAVKAKSFFKGRVENIAKNGEKLHFDLTVIPLCDENEEVYEVLDIRRNITPLIGSEYLDAPTGYPNRAALKRDFKDAPAPAFVLINIDDFGELSDLYGSDIGDRVLCEVANALDEHISSVGVEARLYKLSADEYGVLIPDQSACGGLREYVASLLAALENKEFAIDDFRLSVSASAGYTTSTVRAISRADMALKAAKQNSETIVRFEDLGDAIAQSAKDFEWIGRLRKAIEDDRIAPWFQPIVDMKTGAIVKYECLMRLIDESGDAIAPKEFLRAAKKSRLYPRISRMMIEKSCKYFAEKHYDFSVNITVGETRSKSFCEFLRRVVVETETARRLVIELSQTEHFEKFSGLGEFIDEFKALGCRVAIDDFGIGYSNFKSLSGMKVDFLKIDGSIISQMDSDRQSLAVAETIALFAKKLGVQTIAKFVHSEAIAALAGRIGVDFGQGFLYAKPAGEAFKR